MTSWGRFYTETIVYWTPPTRDSRNNYVFSAPQEIKVSFAEKSEKYIDSLGEERVSNSIVRTDLSLQANGYIYLGSLLDLSDSEKANPVTCKNAFPIRKVMRVKDIHLGVFEYRIIL